jgi:hypothetical protein
VPEKLERVIFYMFPIPWGSSKGLAGYFKERLSGEEGICFLKPWIVIVDIIASSS